MGFTVNTCIYLILLFLVLIVVETLLCQPSNEAYYTIDEDCQAKATKECLSVYNEYMSAPPSENEVMYNKYTDCLSKQLKSCLCEPDVSKARSKACWEAIKFDNEHDERLLGCYDATLSKDEKIACLENPVHFLCSRHPDSEQCADVKVLCDISDFCGAK